MKQIREIIKINIKSKFSGDIKISDKTTLVYENGKIVNIKSPNTNVVKRICDSTRFEVLCEHYKANDDEMYQNIKKLFKTLQNTKWFTSQIGEYYTYLIPSFAKINVIRHKDRNTNKYYYNIIDIEAKNNVKEIVKLCKEHIDYINN